MLKNVQNVEKTKKKFFEKKIFFRKISKKIFQKKIFFQKNFFKFFFLEMSSATQKTPETEKSFQSVSIWSNNKQKTA